MTPVKKLDELIYLHQPFHPPLIFGEKAGKKNVLDIINNVTQSRSNFNFTSINDRSGTYQYKLKMKNVNPLPTDYNTTKTFADCCNERAAELLATGKTVTVSWSGGIDSTVALVSLLNVTQNLSQIKVLLNAKSIEEYPLFYNTYIKDRIETFTLIDQHLSKYIISSENELLVGGDPADYMLGRNFDLPLIGSTIEEWYNYQAENVEYLVSNPALKALIYDKIMHLINTTCPYTVTNGFEAVRWVKFVIGWEQGMNRILKFNLFDKTNIQNRIGFFNTQDFQKWSVSNHDTLVGDTPETFKYILKNYIYDFTGDADYRDNKVKMGSARMENFNDPDIQAVSVIQQKRMNDTSAVMIDSLYNSYTNTMILGSESIYRQHIIDNLVLPSNHGDWIQI